MMESVGLPPKLIRYDSENGIKNKTKLSITTRMLAYSAVLLVLIGIEGFLLATRSDYDATVLRAKGMLYQEQGLDSISNLYTIKLVNKTRDSLPVELRVENYSAAIRIVGKPIVVKREGVSEGTFFVVMSKNELSDRKSKLQIGVYSNREKIKTVKTNFLSNISRKTKK